MYIIYVDEGDGWYVYQQTNHWPDVQKALDTFEWCYYDSKFDEE